MKETSKKFNEILAISLFASLGEKALDQEKKWLEHKELLSEDERLIIEKLDELINSPESYIRIILSHEYTDNKNAKKSPETRLEMAFGKIEGHIESLRKILDELKKEKVKKRNPKK